MDHHPFYDIFESPRAIILDFLIESIEWKEPYRDCLGYKDSTYHTKASIQRHTQVSTTTVDRSLQKLETAKIVDTYQHPHIKRIKFYGADMESETTRKLAELHKQFRTIPQPI